MARTRQTARRSTGAMVPRRQLAQFSSRSSTDIFARQVEIFNQTDCRSIAVEGSAQLSQPPDIIHLSFLVAEESAPGGTLQNGINKVVDKIRQIREAVTALGVPNDSISSDSISAKKKKTDYGSYDDEGTFKVHESVISFHCKSVVRICLGEGVDRQEENIEEIFSKVCFTMTVRLGVNMQEAPTYELSNINDLRNNAREGACENARRKASSMVSALNDSSNGEHGGLGPIRLGHPITITDIPVDLADDANESFLGNDMDLHSYDTLRVVESSEERSRKRARRDAIEPMVDDENDERSSMGSLDEETASALFVVPSINVAAHVRAVFATLPPPGA